MAKRFLIFIICVAMIASASLALAGGPAYAPQRYSKACGPAQGGNCAYWGDAPFPGMCGGVVALPFLVVGSLLGGNPVGPNAAVPPPGYAPAPYANPRYAPQPYANPGCAPQAYANPGCAPQAYGCGNQGSFLGGSMFSGLPCFELCSSLLGAATGGTGLLY